VYTAVLTPIRISFSDDSEYWIYLELFTDILFMSDIIVNFLSAYPDKNGVIVFTKKKISKNYLKSWFFIDFVSSFPLQLVFKLITGNDIGSFGNLNNVLKITKLSKMSRLTKMGRMMNGNN
jgi:hypothetical protein